MASQEQQLKYASLSVQSYHLDSPPFIGTAVGGNAVGGTASGGTASLPGTPSSRTFADDAHPAAAGSHVAHAGSRAQNAGLDSAAAGGEGEGEGGGGGGGGGGEMAASALDADVERMDLNDMAAVEEHERALAGAGVAAADGGGETPMYVSPPPSFYAGGGRAVSDLLDADREVDDGQSRTAGPTTVEGGRIGGGSGGVRRGVGGVGRTASPAGPRPALVSSAGRGRAGGEGAAAAAALSSTTAVGGPGSTSSPATQPLRSLPPHEHDPLPYTHSREPSASDDTPVSALPVSSSASLYPESSEESSAGPAGAEEYFANDNNGRLTSRLGVGEEEVDDAGEASESLNGNGNGDGNGNGGANAGADRTASRLPMPLQPLRREDYVFPRHRLPTQMKDSSKIPLVIVACGSFSPPTYLHLRIFEMAKDQVTESDKYELLAGYYSPVSDHYKKEGLALATHRVRMCELAVAKTSTWLMVDAWESLQDDYTRTAVVLDHFDEELNVHGQGVLTKEGERKRIKVMLLAGGDLIQSMGEPGVWSTDDLHHILGHFGCLIVERTGADVWSFLLSHDILWKYRYNLKVVKQTIYNDISSSKVRLFVRRGLSIKYLLPNSVIHYIEENKLYQLPEESDEDRQVAK